MELEGVWPGEGVLVKTGGVHRLRIVLPDGFVALDPGDVS